MIPVQVFYDTGVDGIRVRTGPVGSMERLTLLKGKLVVYGEGISLYVIAPALACASRGSFVHSIQYFWVAEPTRSNQN